MVIPALSHLMFALAAGLAAGFIASTPAPAEERGFGAWIAACDNTHRCTVLSTRDLGYVFLVREAGDRRVRLVGALSVDIADVQTRDIEWAMTGREQKLILPHVDGPGGVVRGESDEGAVFIAALTAAPPGTAFVLRSGNAGEIDFSADGFRDAWAWVERKQALITTMPTLAAAKAAQKPLPKKPPNAVARDWQASCNSDGAKKGDWGRLRVSEQTTVWRLSCGSYQRLFAHDERTDKVRLLRLPYPKPAGEVHPLERLDAEVSLNPGVLGVTAYHLADCRNTRGQSGFIGRWRWTGKDFDLESFSRFADEEVAGYGGRGCVPHEDWPSVYRVAVP